MTILDSLSVAILFLSSSHVFAAAFCWTRQRPSPTMPPRLLFRNDMNSLARGGGRGGDSLAASSSTSDNVVSDGGGEGEGTPTATSNKQLFQFYNMANGMCPYAARTCMTLLELNLPFDTVDVSPMKREEWYLKINPSNKVPALQNTVDGTVVYESAICNEYLSDYARQIDATTTTTTLDGIAKLQEHDAAAAICWKLMPVSAADRAALRLLHHHVDTVLNPAVFTLLMNKKHPEQDASMKEAVENALELLQDSLITRGGPYLMGRDFSLADIHVLPFILRMLIALKHYKNGYEVLSSSPTTGSSRFQPLLDWFQLCSKRSSVQAVSKTNDQIVQVYDKFMDMDYAFGGLNKNKT